MVHSPIENTSVFSWAVVCGALKVYIGEQIKDVVEQVNIYFMRTNVSIYIYPQKFNCR